MSNIKKLHQLSKDFVILYVEDDASIRNSMATYLKKIFKEVIIANDGKEGLKKYKKHTIDIVVTDLSMPVMNGLEMLTEIKKRDTNQSVLITSAHSETEYMFGAINAGVDGYIIKPFDYTQLNNELYKIADKLSKFKENEVYKNHLEDMVKERTAEIEKIMNYQSDNYEKTLYSMVDMIEERDTYTAGHSKRVAKYSAMIAKDMGFSEVDCTKIYQAGILHDIGKVATPDAVLLNPKSLNEIEYTLIKEHVTVSYKLLNAIPMFQELSEIVRDHHERYDGKGYPRALKKDAINPMAKIMIVADSFDAMTTNRIYKAKKSVAEAIEELQFYNKKQFHPEVVKVAIKTLQNIEIDEDVNQLPKTKLEEERFAYFYKDPLTKTYNSNYFDLIISSNSIKNDSNYKVVYKINLKKFSDFNKINGWEEGNTVLKLVASELIQLFQEEPVFRIFGDDFAVLCENKKDTQAIDEVLRATLNRYKIAYALEIYDLDDVNLDIATIVYS